MPISIELVDSSIAITRDSSDANSLVDYIPVHAIRGLSGSFDQNTMSYNNRKPSYRYDDLIRVSIQYIDPNTPDLFFDVQDVSNQAGWTSDISGLNQALEDINGWISTGIGGTGGGGGGGTSNPEESLTLTSILTTGSGTIPAGVKSVSIHFNGNGGTLNGTAVPDGWAHSLDYDNDILPAIPYNGNGSTVTIFYLT